VVDYDYRGPVGVVLFNHSEEDFVVKRGDRIAQLILERISMASVEEADELFDTARGSGGFGSTGVSAAAEDPSAKRPR
jgi:deoxyuridine 5'-triphosphate nucleotidohydrolase